MEQHGGTDIQTKDGGRDQHGDDAQANPQVLFDDAAGAARQADRERQLRQVVGHQRHVGSLQRDIGAGRAHGNAHSGVGHRRRIVDAVADHRHLAVFCRKLDLSRVGR
jgi:hypothetical protein